LQMPFVACVYRVKVQNKRTTETASDRESKILESRSHCRILLKLYSTVHSNDACRRAESFISNDVASAFVHRSNQTPTSMQQVQQRPWRAGFVHQRGRPPAAGLPEIVNGRCSRLTHFLIVYSYSAIHQHPLIVSRA